uniref:DUF3782 domain-containing protein n=1 Tax=Candidatus Kentrum sp. TC TaxID=2126339 RepID=A0A450Z851_9GAMM|nr:MAG: hypothetical protein BECKTC1821E_GA0114239_10836 [Candidatus Kentron sp. TC]VFK49955.1 MAG: hypothetical protein BECKTC1821D_GA0114238_10858 [Candidatus Kentron sp. TC]
MSAITYEQVLSLFEKYAEAAERRSRDFDRGFEETDRQLKELGRRIGGLGDKFDYFTEGLALPSMERILKEQFGMIAIAPRLYIRENGEEMEIDVLAWANDDINLAVPVEVKSRVKQESIEQLQKLVGHFREFFPEHRGKAAMGESWRTWTGTGAWRKRRGRRVF